MIIGFNDNENFVSASRPSQNWSKTRFSPPFIVFWNAVGGAKKELRLVDWLRAFYDTSIKTVKES